MKFCKICGKEAMNKRLVYCSNECSKIGRSISIKIKKDLLKEKYLESKAKWKHEEIKIGETKHNRTVAINFLDITNSVKTHLKFLLREYDLTTKEYAKLKRCDGVIKDFLVVVVTPQMIKDMFYKRYEIYKNNFRLDCLRTVKTLLKIFNLVNDYYDKKWIKVTLNKSFW